MERTPAPGAAPPAGEGPAVVVLGATGGIGRVLCERLARRGARVLAVARGAERLEELARATGAETLAADARRADAVEDAVASARARFGRLDGAVNLVGSLLLKPAHRTRPEEWDDVVATNLGSAFHLVRAAAPRLEEGGGVVLTSSAAAGVGLVNHDAIAAAKAGVEGLARSAAASYAARGVRVNCVAPGLVRTPLTAGLTRSEPGRRASVAMHPLGRLGEPEDVVRAIEWLLDGEASWVSGQVIGVDGGLRHLRGKVRA